MPIFEANPHLGHGGEVPPQVVITESQRLFRVVMARYHQLRADGLLPADAPWSLAELGFEDDDFEILKCWAALLPVGLIHGNEEPYTEFDRGNGVALEWFPWPVVLGALLLLTIAEVARCYSSGGELWPVIARSGPFRGQAKAALLNQFNIPTPLLLGLIETACRRLNLRHRFPNGPGEFADGQRNYGTVFLQIGFSQPAARRNIAGWLAGRLYPEAMQQLLDQGNNLFFSKSFSHFWNLIRRISQGLNPVEERRCPWGSARFAEELFEIARTAHPNLQGNLNDREPALPAAVGIRDLPPPTVGWIWTDEGALPSARIDLGFLDGLGPHGVQGLRLAFDGVLVPNLGVDGNGHVRCDIGGNFSEHLILRLQETLILAAIKSGTDESADSSDERELDTWSLSVLPSEDSLSLLHRVGPESVGILDPLDSEFQLKTHGHYGLIASSRMQVFLGNAPLDGRPLDAAGRFCFFNIGDNQRAASLVVKTIDGQHEILRLAGAGVGRLEILRRSIQLSGDVGVDDGLISVRIVHSPELLVQFVWCQAEIVFEVQLAGTGTLVFVDKDSLRDHQNIALYVEAIELATDVALRPVRLRSVNPLGGIFRRVADGYQHVSDGAAFCWEFKTGGAIIRIPNCWNANHGRLNLGGRGACRATTPRILAQLASGNVFGESALIRQVDRRRLLAGSLEDGGWLKPDSAEYRDGRISVQLALKRYLLLGGDRLVVWLRSGAIVHLPANPGQDDCVFGEGVEAASDFRTVSLWRDGRCLGTARAGNWCDQIGAAHLPCALEFMQWARVPIAQGNALPILNGLIGTNSFELIFAWASRRVISATGPGEAAESIECSRSDGGFSGESSPAACWLLSASEIIRGITFPNWTDAQCFRLVRSLETGVPVPANAQPPDLNLWSSAMNKLLEFDPILCRRFVQRICRQGGPLHDDAREVRNLLSLHLFRRLSLPGQAFAPQQALQGIGENLEANLQFRLEQLFGDQYAGQVVYNLANDLSDLVAGGVLEDARERVCTALSLVAGRNLASIYVLQKDFHVRL